MTLSDWFTIITILLAVLAFFSQTERKILLLKTRKWNLAVTGIILFFIIPILLFYEKLILVFPVLNKPPFSFSNRFLPSASAWAFILIFIAIGFWVWWFSFKLKKVKPSEELIQHYLKSMNTMPFENLFQLFIKYEETQLEEAINFKVYGHLLANERFFNSALNYNPNLYLGIIQKLDAKIILDSRLPVIVKDKINALTAEQKRLGVSSPYNYEPTFHDKWPKEDLLLFNLLDCYFAFMEECIDANLFASDKSGFTMLNSFAETMFLGILESIHIPDGLDVDKEEPTYNHKLLSNIFNALNTWIDLADAKKNKFIGIQFASLYSRCLFKLLLHNDEIISNYYLEINFNVLMRRYFEPPFVKNVNEIRTEIENTFLHIPYERSLKDYYKKRFKVCWDYSDNDLWLEGSNNSQRPMFIQNVVEKIENS